MERRTLAAASAITLASAVLLVGCSADADDTAASTPVTETCTEMYVGGGDPLERAVGDVLIRASQGFDGTVASSMNAVGKRLQELEKSAPTSFTAAIQKVEQPFLQVQEGLDQGTESTEIDIASATEGLTEIRDLCADAGFDFPSAAPTAAATPSATS
ncbi:hypothetical protein [Sediminihabitans luteus]|nr:hypothetical protein [Sediminihabitans luteus]